MAMADSHSSQDTIEQRRARDADAMPNNKMENGETVEAPRLLRTRAFSSVPPIANVLRTSKVLKEKPVDKAEKNNDS